MSFVDQYTFVCMYINLFAVLVYIKTSKFAWAASYEFKFCFKPSILCATIKGFDIQINSNKHSGYFYFGF